MSYKVTKLDLSFQGQGRANGVIGNRKEGQLHSSIIILDRNTEHELLKIRWYNSPKSSRYRCCVWLSLTVDYVGMPVRLMSIYLAGGASSLPGYGENALHLSLNKACEAAGIFFERPKEDNGYNTPTCNIRLETYVRNIMDGINDWMIEQGAKAVDYIMAYAYA